MSDYSNTHWMKDAPENFHCQPDIIVKTEPTLSGIFRPEKWSIDKMVIRNATDALQSGLEYAKECLATHDSSLGRTTKKNKSWAEIIESDIRLIEKSIKELKIEEISRTTHYP